MRVPLRRPLLPRAFVLLPLGAITACGGAPAANVQTGPTPAQATPAQATPAQQSAEAGSARAALEALDEIVDTRVCITPELCEDLRSWTPDRVLALDGHLVALGDRHAFVWMDGQWAHHAMPLHDTPMSNGHAAFFCDHEGGVFELTTAGVRRRGTLPSPGCAAVVAAGEQLYVVVGDGPILRQDANAWVPLRVELPYGNGYSIDTVAMTPTRALMIDERARLLELPRSGPDFEPRLVAETGLDHMATLATIPGTETVLAHSRELAIVEASSVRRLAFPGPAAPTTENASPEDEESEGEEEAGGADGIQMLSETEMLMGRWLVGLDPLIVARGHVRLTPPGASGELTLEHFVLRADGWQPLPSPTPESFPIAFGQGGLATTMPDRTMPVHLGGYRVVVHSYHGARRGPVVVASSRDGLDVVATAFAPETTRSALVSQCEREGVHCAMTPAGLVVRLVSSPTPALELLGADGSVVLRHEGGADLRVLDVAGRERLYVMSRDGSVGYVDGEGLHTIARAARSSAWRGLHVATDTTAYLVGGDGHVSYFDGTALTRAPRADVVASEHLWYRLADGVVVPVAGQWPVWIRGLEVRSLELGGAIAPDIATRTPDGEVVLAARDGRAWILRGADVLEVTAPSPDAAHAEGPIYFLPESTLQGVWRVSFADPQSFGGTAYLAPAPTPRPLGTISSCARPYRAPTAAADP